MSSIPSMHKFMASAALASVAEALERSRLRIAPSGHGPGRPATSVRRSCEPPRPAVSARSEELATILTREHGKPLADARKEIKAAIDTFDFYAEEARRIGGELAPSRPGPRAA